MEARIEMEQLKSNIKVGNGTYVLYLISYILIGIGALICLLPFIMLVSGSVSDNALILKEGYSIIPKGLTISAYKTIFANPLKIGKAYGITISRTVIGTSVGLFVTTMTGYVLSRPDFEYRNKYSFFLYFTTLFNGGTIPWYIVTKEWLGLNNNIFALIVPMTMSAFNIFLMKNFLKSIPHDLAEAARIDGCGDFRIFLTIFLPLSKPALATVGLFMALAYWNDWFQASLLINNSDLYPLQYVLFTMMANANSYIEGVVMNEAMPTETIKLAMAIITTGPVLLFYPFAQRYIVSGLTIGGVKG